MRLYFLDNIKAALIALVVIHHAGQAYGPTDYWPIRSDEQLAWLGPFFEVNGAFFMGLFFMISAYFLPGSMDRKGVGPTLKDRFIRLGIPLLFMTIFIFGPITYFADEIPGSFWNYMLFDYIGGGDFELAHLWFLSLLLFFTVCYAAGRTIVGDRAAVVPVESEAPTHLMLMTAVLVLIMANALMRLWFPVGVWVDVLPLMPVELGRMPQYAGLFIAGLVASRRGWLLTIPLRQAATWFAIALLAAISVYLNAITGWLPDAAWLVQEALIGVGFCVSLPVLTRELWNRQGGLLKQMADGAFAVYLIHIIIIYVVQGAMEATALGAAAKFLVVATLGVVISFGISYLLRRIPGVGRVL